MVKVFEEELGIQIYTFVGGLNLMRNTPEDAGKIGTSLKVAGIKQICPIHCTGDQSISMLAK